MGGTGHFEEPVTRPAIAIVLAISAIVGGILWRVSGDAALSSAADDHGEADEVIGDGAITEGTSSFALATRRPVVPVVFPLCRDREVVVLTRDGAPVVGASLRSASMLDPLLADGEAERTTGRDGSARWCTADEADGRPELPWLLVTHPGFVPQLCSPRDWGSADRFEVRLDAPQPVRVQVVDRDHRPILGARVTLRGRFGDELRLRAADSGGALTACLAPEVIATDAMGRADFTLAPGEPYRLRVDGVEGAVPVEFRLDEEDRRRGRVEVQLGFFVLAGIRLPRGPSGRVLRSGMQIEFPRFEAGRDGLVSATELQWEQGAREACVRPVAQRLQLDVRDVCWFLAAEIDPALAREAKSTVVRLGPQLPEGRVALQFRRPEALVASDLAELPLESGADRLGEIEVCFEGASAAELAEAEEFFRLEPRSQRGWGAYPGELAEADRPDPVTGRTTFRFLVAEGEWRCRLFQHAPMASRFAPSDESVEVHVGSPSRIVLHPGGPPACTSVRFRATDESGRPLRAIDLLVGGDDPGSRAVRRPADDTGEPKIALPAGRWFVYGSAFGYRPLDPVGFEVAGDESELLVPLRFEFER